MVRPFFFFNFNLHAIISLAQPKHSETLESATYTNMYARHCCHTDAFIRTTTPNSIWCTTPKVKYERYKDAACHIFMCSVQAQHNVAANAHFISRAFTVRRLNTKQIGKQNASYLRVVGPVHAVCIMSATAATQTKRHIGSLTRGDAERRCCCACTSWKWYATVAWIATRRTNTHTGTRARAMHWTT